MPLNVNIKRKDPKFQGDQPSWNAVVGGPSEVFTEPLKRLLFLHGLTALSSEGEEWQNWCTRPAIGAPMLYLAPILKQKYHAQIKPEVQKMLKDAVSERLPEDGLEAFIGRSKPASAGAKSLAIVAGSKDFIANCDAGDEARILLLEGAGWLPISNPTEAVAARFGSQPFRTRDPYIAGNLEPFMDEKSRQKLGVALAQSRDRIRRSKSQDAPEGFSVPVPEGLDYLPFQKGGISEVLGSGNSAIIADDMGLGKAQPLDSRILTPQGWRRMGEIQVGDMVVGSDGRPTRVEGIYPQGLKEIFRVTFNDGATTECCDEHLWQVNSSVGRRMGRPWKVQSLRDVRQSLHDAAGNRRHFIPMVSPVEMTPKDLPLDPYLLGFLLGDGCMMNHYTHFSSADADLVSAVADLVPESLQVKHIQNDDYRIGSAGPGVPNEVHRTLKSLGLTGKGSDDKFIPEIYLIGSVSQRVALLQGLLDTDGFISTDGVLQFSSNSTQLLEGVAQIVMSLGGNARHTSKITASGKTHHLLTIALSAEVVPFRIARKASRYVPRQKYKPTRAFAKVESLGLKLAQCIKVAAADHLYVTDDFIVTHNTIQGIGILNGRTANSDLAEGAADRFRAIVFCQANMRLKWVREINKWKINQGLTVGHAEGKDWPDTDVVVINYDIVKNHTDRIRDVQWDIVLADEAHNLKNPEAQRTQAILGDLLSDEGQGMIPLADKGQLVHLTGTPKPNRIAELWPLVTSTRPDIWGRGPTARQAFLNRYEPPTLIKKKMRRGNREYEIIIPMPGKPVRELELQLRLRGSGSFIRRLKRDTDLPPKFRTPIEMPFKLSKEELALLREAEADLSAIQERLLEGQGARAGRSREAREIIDVISGLSPDSPAFQEIARVRRNLGALKAPHAAEFIIDELKEDNEIAEEDRRKTVVFAHHHEVIETISRMAEEAFPGGVLVYDGGVSNKKRQDRIDKFMEDPKARLFIMSLAGATGITLTSSARMRVVEPDWSPSNMVQIEDRIWRIGQERNCDIGYLFVPNSLDVRMGLALISKMETDERSINSLSFRGMRRAEQPAKDPKETSSKETAQPSRKSENGQSEFHF